MFVLVSTYMYEWVTSFLFSLLSNTPPLLSILMITFHSIRAFVLYKIRKIRKNSFAHKTHIVQRKKIIDI